MKLLALLVLLCACEHDPRYEHHARRVDRPSSPASMPVDAAGSDRTVERHGVDVAPIVHAPNVAPITERTHRHRRH